MILCPYCNGLINLETLCCSGCNIQYNLKKSKNKKIPYLQKNNNNLLIPLQFNLH